MSAQITAEDVYRVANDLCIGITDAQVETVLELYDGEQAEDPTANWTLIVEKIIWDL